ncbi:MAG: hypothetical protein NZ932_06680 [Candidatus Bathyarchaeota archaeon]|nr:hypothetical protein [Candidatus Bathyarchaeota archaeon]MDW8040309.1 hypothetical protein [Nitrososphaerota archaeon]
MQSKRERVKIGRERLQRVIEMCQTVEERSLDPFLVNVDEIIRVIREFFPEWENPEDLCLDAEAINRLASVIKLQSEWVKHRSTSLYTDPFLLEEKVKRLEKETIVEAFLGAWQPIIELEQITFQSLKEALQYWESLSPLKDRWKAFPTPEEAGGTATREELIKLKVLRDKAFTEELENFWNELKRLAAEKGENGRVSYWDFVGAETYEETVHRAFLTSFLVTYGYATLEINPLEEKIFIRPFKKQQRRISKEQLVSIPIAITREEWERWRK